MRTDSHLSDRVWRSELMPVAPGNAGVGIVVGADVAAVADAAEAVADYSVAGNCNRILCVISIEPGHDRNTLD